MNGASGQRQGREVLAVVKHKPDRAMVMAYMPRYILPGITFVIVRLDSFMTIEIKYLDCLS